MTKYNRELRNLPKTHWLDAACVGKVTPRVLQVKQIKPLAITAKGYGSRQMCLMTEFLHLPACGIGNLGWTTNQACSMLSRDSSEQASVRR